MTGFHSFVKKKETVAFPEETFDTSGGSAAEQEQSIGNEETHPVTVGNDRGKRIDTQSHVCISANEVDGREVGSIGISKHSGPP